VTPRYGVEADREARAAVRVAVVVGVVVFEVVVVVVRVAATAGCVQSIKAHVAHAPIEVLENIDPGSLSELSE
jgi:hypothetical protein